MILREHRIIIGNRSTINLRPFGDIQFGVPAFDKELWKRWCAETREDPNCLTIGMGDYSDHFRPTNQKKISGMTHDDGDFKQGLDDLYYPHMMHVAAMLKPYINPRRCLGLLEGHHFYRFKDGMTSTQKMCQELGVAYLGISAFVVLKLNMPKSNGKLDDTRTLVIHAQHGEGGSQYISSDVPQLERKTLPFWDADLYLRGHSTKAWTGAVPLMRVTTKGTPRLLATDRWMVNTGGFMRGYLENDAEGTYVEKKKLAPAKLGYCTVHLHPTAIDSYELDEHGNRRHTGLNRIIRMSVTAA